MNKPISTKPGGRFTEWRNLVDTLFFRVADRFLSSRRFLPHVPAEGARNAAAGRLSIEVVSHCWQYAHLLAYSLSAYVNHPPTAIDVTVTVFYSPEDQKTVAMLDYFGGIDVANVRWNWQPILPERLLRRAIGRNQAALATRADWIWFADCDLIFHEGCLDALATQLQGRRDSLLYPGKEWVTPLLENENPMLNNDCQPALVEIDPTVFQQLPITRAIGAYQIVHGDVARACGYCNNIRVFQSPTRHWRKTYEDRVFRWLLETQGVAIDVPQIYRIRHITKGRYQQGSVWSKLREKIRATQSRLREK